MLVIALSMPSNYPSLHSLQHLKFGSEGEMIELFDADPTERPLVCEMLRFCGYSNISKDLEG